MNNFKQEAAANQPPPVVTRDTQYLHTYTVGAILPFLQASITAVLIFIGSLVVAYFVFDIIDPLKPAVTLATLSWIGTWLARQSRWLMLTAERLTGIDINRDGVVGTEKKEPDVIRIQVREIKQDGAYQVHDNIDLPISREQLEALARGLLNGVPFSERKWTAPNNDIFSSNEFRTLRSIMVRRQLIELVNEKDARQGYKLTHQGRSIMEYYASPSPTPDVDDGETE